MIPLDQCKHGYLYKISSRNLSLGVFNEPDKGFIGVREKFGDTFLFTEFHHDTGPPFGTVVPRKELEQYPGEVYECRDGIDNADLRAWLDAKQEELR